MEPVNKLFYVHIAFILFGGFLVEAGILLFNTVYTITSLLLLLIGILLLVKGIRHCIL